MEDASIITCHELWQVFGPNPATALENAISQSNGAYESVVTFLREHGCTPAVQNASFSIEAGELFVIMGLSGSGKSTLVRCMSQLLPGTSGQIFIEGEDVVRATKRRMTQLRRHKLGMVFQHFGLFPHMSVLDNVAYPLKVQGIGKNQRYSRAEEVISLVGLNGREASYPRELSGGQRQRVGIARSLSVNPDIWFLDEPFSALDPLIRRQLQNEFLNIQSTLNKTIVFITHDMNEALKLADRIAIMRDGKIVQIGTPSDIVLNPADDYVREFSKDVAKGQHAMVSSVMLGKDEFSVSDDPGLTTTMTLDAALARCVNLFDAVPVRDNTGNIVGTVRPSDLATTIQADDAKASSVHKPSE